MGRDVRLSLREVFEAVELPQMEEPDPPGRRRCGRPPYPPRAMLNSLLLIPLGVASERELARKLKTIPSLAEDCGFEEQTPDQSTINRFKHRLGVEGVRGIFRGVVKKLVREGVVEGSSIAVDATKLEALKGDPDAEWGHVEAEKAFFGYKIHVVADFKSEMPIEVRVTPANRHENREFKPLVREARNIGLKASRICGDAIHDTKATRRFVKTLGACALIDHNPRRHGKEEKKIASKSYRRLKASVERVFSRAKELLNLRNIRVRGLNSITMHVYTVFVAMLSIASAANRNGLEKHIRCIRSVFG